MNNQEVDIKLARLFASLRNNPLGFVEKMFPWNEGTLKDREPDKWQRKFLEALGDELSKRRFNYVDPLPPIQFSTASGTGIGKSTMVAWLILFIMSTRPKCRGIVTANTAAQLNTRTWPELGKWYNLFLAKHWFVYKNNYAYMTLKHKDFPEDWQCRAQTCDKSRAEAFQGLHCAHSSPFFIVDEASAVPDIIFETIQGSVTDGEPFIILWGNPNRGTGFFRETHRKFKNSWHRFTIDSRDSQNTNKEYIKRLIEENGINSDIVRVRVLGQFPNQATNQFIADMLVDGAYGKELEASSYSFAPSILGCDPAWTGKDNLVIVHRKGLFSEILDVIPKNDDDTVIGRKLCDYQDKLKAQGVFIDLGLGTGIYSYGKSVGRNWDLFSFAGKSPNEGCANFRAYIWNEMKQWLKEGGAIPPNAQLKEDLINVETKSRLDGKILLESKDEMKKRGLESPNIADALALTFAKPVHTKLASSSNTWVTQFNPYE